MQVSKTDQVKGYVWKNDQLLFLYIAVDRFFRRTLSLDRFLKQALPLDRFLSRGIEAVLDLLATLGRENFRFLYTRCLSLVVSLVRRKVLH